MPILHAIILGIIQGLTEFLPISSSGHLAIIPQILGWNDLSATAEKTFDIALHAGTLVGAIVYLRKDIIEIIKSTKSSWCFYFTYGNPWSFTRRIIRRQNSSTSFKASTNSFYAYYFCDYFIPC